MNNASLTRSDITAAIERERDRVLDLDLHVDRCREDVDDRLSTLQDAVRVRDAAAMHLQNLIDWLDREAA